MTGAFDDEPTLAGLPDAPEARAPTAGGAEATISGEPSIAGRGEAAPEATLSSDSAERHRPTPALPTVPGYLIEAELGRGGMGVVYRARRIRLNRVVALKMILAGEHAGVEAAVRFLAEAESIARLQHPNIVQIYHIDEHAGRPYFEMEYVGGGSLADRADGQPRPPREAARLVARLARAVASAHAAGIVHRDLKPANILIADDGTPKVADFGLAKSLEADGGLTRTDSILGSPTYMAPEQAEGRTREVGATADIYSLGAILYEGLTGRPPFVGATLLDTLQQVKTSEPVAPSRLVHGLPRDVETIALKCLEKSAGRRYASASDLADDLERFLEGTPIVARPVPFWERGWKWVRRRPAVAALVAMLAASAVAMLVTAGVSYNRIRDALDAADVERGRAVRAQAEEFSARTRAEADRVRADASRDAALVETYRASISEARALRSARLPGWRDAALGNLARLATLPTPRRDLFELRSEAVACLGDFDIREVARLDGGRSEAFGLDFLPDGRTLATAHRGGVRLWDVRRLSFVGSLTSRPSAVVGQGWCTAAEATPRVRHRPDGGGIAYTTPRDGIVWDRLRAPGEAHRPLTRGATVPKDLAFDASGRRVAVAWGDGLVEVRDASSGLTLSAGKTAVAGAMALSPDGRWLAVSGFDRGVWLRPVDGEPTPITPGRLRATVTAIAFNAAGTTLASGSADGEVMLWDLAQRIPRFPLLGHKSQVTSVTFSRDGTRIATSSTDHTVRVWDARSGRELAVLEQPSFAIAVAFSPDGDYLASSCVYDTFVRLYKIEGLREQRRLVGHLTGLERLAFRPGKADLASGDVSGSVILWDAETARRRHAWRAHGSFISSLTYSPDGSTLATGAGQGDSVVKLWDAGTGAAVRTLAGPESQVTAIAFSPSGGRIGAATIAGGLRVWNTADGTPARPPGTLAGHVSTLAFLDEHRLLAQIHLGDLYLLDMTSVEPPRSLPIPGGGTSFTIDRHRSRAIVWGQSGDYTIVALPDLTLTGTVRSPHRDPVFSMAITPDGRLLASGGEERRLILSDAATLRPLLSFPPRIGRVKTLGFGLDGSRLAVGGIDSDGVIWDLALIRDGLAPLGLAWDGPTPESGETLQSAPNPAAIPTMADEDVDPAESTRADGEIASARAARRQGRADEAVVRLRSAVDRLRRLERARMDDPRAAGRLAGALVLLGSANDSAGTVDEARAATVEARNLLESLDDPTPAELFDLARACSRLIGAGDRNGPSLAGRAVEALRRAVDRSAPGSFDIAGDPDFGPIRGDAAFRDLLLDLAFPVDPFAPLQR